MTSAAPSLRKAAIVLRTLDKTLADKLLGRLQPAYAHAVAAELERLEQIDLEEQQRIVEEFKHLMQVADSDVQVQPDPHDAPPAVADGRVTSNRQFASAPNAVEPPLRPALAAAAEDTTADTDTSQSRTAPFSFLKNVPLKTLCAAIGQEQPRVVAFVLSHLPAARAARILENLPERLQHEVVRFMSTPASVQPALRCQVEQRLRCRIEAGQAAGRRQADGVTKAAQLLSRTARATAGRILAGLEKADPDLAARLHRSRWSLDSLGELDDALLRLLLGRMQPSDLALAMKGASPRLCKRCLRLLPKGVARQVKGHLKSLGPVRLSDIEAAQAYMISLLDEVCSFSTSPAEDGRYASASDIVRDG